MLAPVEFVEQGHRYFVGSRELPGVSRVMEAEGLKGYFKEGPDYKNRGKAVHHAFNLMNQKRYLEAGTHPALVPYTRGLEKFLRSYRYRALVSELPMGSARLNLAGTLDSAGVFDDGPEIDLIDVKTGTLPRAVGVQLALYKMLAQDCGRLPLEGGAVKIGFKIRSCKSLLLPGNEDFVLSSFDEPRWMTSAQSVLNLYNLKKDLGLLPKER
jgi:hypothetical protein